MHGLTASIDNNFPATLGYGAILSDAPEVHGALRSIETQILPVPNKGNCLFSCSAISAGQCVITAPAYRILEADLKALTRCDLYKYVFYDADRRRLGTARPEGFMVFGALSFCSHSSKPNTRVAWLYHSEIVLVRLIALTSIAPGQEITMRYSNIDEYEGADSWV